MESNSIGQPMANEIKKLLPVSMRNKVELFYTSNASKNDYIERLALDLEQGNLYFLQDNELLFDQFKTYALTKSKTGKNVYNALPGYHDDCVISLALANFCRYENKGKSNNNNIMIIKR